MNEKYSARSFEKAAGRSIIEEQLDDVRSSEHELETFRNMLHTSTTDEVVERMRAWGG